MKTVTILFFITLLLFAGSTYSQGKPNSLYFELLGNGGIYSVNYDRLFTGNIGGRIGIMYLSELDIIVSSFQDLLIIPVTINYLVGSGNNKLEFGAGVVYVHISGGEFFGLGFNEGSGTLGTATIGYRYQQTDGGLLFRIGFTPVFSPEGLLPMGGISLGTSF
ncbi:hypothetical protein EHM76_03560 [bacterium]|nr:MAG: hypothetical protein EHM76_03560 [bacterium]